MFDFVTNVDKRNGKHKKSVWYLSSETFPEDITGGPSRYGPSRTYVANCMSVEIADLIVRMWNVYRSDQLSIERAEGTIP